MKTLPEENERYESLITHLSVRMESIMREIQLIQQELNAIRAEKSKSRRIVRNKKPFRITVSGKTLEINMKGGSR